MMGLNIAVVSVVLLYVVAGSLSLILAPLYVVNQLTLFENPENPFNILYLMFSIIVVLVIVIIISRLRLEILLKGLFYFSAFTVLSITISMILPDSLIWLMLSVAASILLLILLDRFYKWYLVNTVGVFLSASIAAWFGASLSPPILVTLLLVMAIYDYFAVRSGVMISLAEETLKMNLPTMLMSPVRKTPKEFKMAEGGEKRGAFLGLGDVAFPNMLTVSTYLTTGNLMAAILVLSGGIAGLIIVLYVVRRFKRPQPGLPYIGLGAALGWIASILMI
jgi:presenilin-like A22 family membrane protease